MNSSLTASADAREIPAGACIVCGQRLAPSKLPGLLECTACRFITADVQISDAELAALYGPDYFHGSEYRDYESEEQSLKLNFRKRLDELEAIVGPLRDKELFEVGSAYGFFLDEAKRRVRHARGIDISAAAAAAARDKLGVDVTAGDYLAHPVEPVDLLCMWDTVEHLSRPDLFVQKAARDLKPGGYLAVTTGDIGSFNARMRGRHWRMIHPPTHLHYFSTDTMTRMLDRAGFDVVRVTHPGVSRDLRSIAHFILALRLGWVKAYERIAKWRLLNMSLTMNLWDIMFVVAKKRG